jgi:signal transduction histidine kinase/CheY-like chemotaxis protein
MGGSRDLMAVRANGEVFPIEASISRAGEGAQQRMTVMARDVTQLRQAERAQLARTAAEAANQAKTEFLSRISHELRTPLNAVLGFAQLMRRDTRDPLSEHHRAQLDLVLQAGSHLSALIEEILDVARIETGRMALEECDFELCELLGGVMALCEPQALQCQVTLQAGYDGMAPIRLHTDPARLRQVMLNLLSNAIKYNRPGGWVRVEVQRRPGAVHLRVQDNGLGMTDQQKSRLFQPFNRLGREYSEVQGTGIGLVLVRQLVSLMHGELTVESSTDHGTCVHVSLPLAESCAVDAASSPGEPAASGLPAREGVVLYVEDNPVNAVLVEQLLARWPKVRTVVAPDGQSGLERARTLRPDLVLLDMELPDMHGMAVLRALKADPATRDVPVVVLSASACAVSQQAARDAGALHYWTKPIDFDRFVDGMRELLPHGVEA